MHRNRRLLDTNEDLIPAPALEGVNRATPAASVPDAIPRCRRVSFLFLSKLKICTRTLIYTVNALQK